MTNASRAHALVQRSFLRLFTEPEVAPSELLEVADRAIGVFDELGDELGLARAWRLKAQAHYLARRAGAAVDASEQALAHIRRAGDRFEEREIVEWLLIALSVGPVTADDAAERCRRLLDEVGAYPLLEAVVAAFLASFESTRGGTREAEQAAGRALRAMDEHGEKVWRLSIELAHVPLAEDDPVAAERELRPAYDALKRMGEKTHFSTLVELLSNVVYMQGRYEEAEELIRECEQAARSNDVHAQIRWRAMRAKVIARKGELGAAEELAREAVAFAAKSDFLNDRADALVDQAEVLRFADRRAEASSAVEDAVALYEQKGNAVSAGRARRLLEELRDTAPSAP